MKKSEENLQIAVSNYIKLQYPDVYFTSESSGIRVSIGTAVKMKKQRSKHKQLDMIILEPRGRFHGLVLELKKDKGEVFKKDGEFRKKEHVKEQWDSIRYLSGKGYYCGYGFGFDDCKKTIDWYMTL